MTWLTDLLSKWREMLLVGAFFMGLGWTVAKPWAEDFINETVKDQIVALQGKLADLQLSLDNQKSIDVVSQAKITADMDTNKKLLEKLLDLELRRTQP